LEFGLIQSANAAALRDLMWLFFASGAWRKGYWKKPGEKLIVSVCTCGLHLPEKEPDVDHHTKLNMMQLNNYIKSAGEKWHK